MRIADEGPDGALAGTTHPDGCEMALPVETTPDPALPPHSRRCREVWHPSRPWQRWERTKAGGQDQLLSPTAPLRPKLLMTCCHHFALRFAVSARHLQQCRLLLLEICVSFARWLQGSRTRTAAVLMALRRWQIQPSRGCWFQLQGVSTASRLPGSVRDEVVIVAEGEDI